NLVASGWILDKSPNQIVVGDTNRFQETYALDDNVKVYELNTKLKTIAGSSLSNIPVTQKTNGKYSLTANRQMVVAVFDRNYKRADEAKVVEIYYLTPQTVVPAKYLFDEYDTMSQYSYYPDTKTEGVVTKPSSMPWIAYTKPFTIVEDRMYFVGDNDVACYLFKTDTGLALLDYGWPPCGYLYYLSIEKSGFDPRAIKYLLLSHGHGDHYGTVVEFNKMIRNAGGNPQVVQTYEDAKGYDKYGFPAIGATTPDLAVNAITDDFYTWEKWMDFGGVRVYPILTPGHTNGTGSFIFEVTPKGKAPITFGYMGGFGTIHTPDQGYRRAQFVYSLKYLQQNIKVDYSLPQHCAHFPMLELNKAAEKAGISFLDALVKDNDEWVNFLERRLVAQEMEMYRLTLDRGGKIQVKYPDGKVKEFVTQTAAPQLVRNEVGGPWKRAGGEYKITLVDGGKLMHGFNILQNSNPLLNGVYNSNGDNLGDGVIITRDGYMHDPDKWFLQISARVKDGYRGELTNLTGALNGPVESLFGKDWYEILRTVYFDSKEKAQAVLAKLQAGQTYTVTLDKNSNIQMAEDITKIFR
ncbi:MBL fold metallo-hydrolase, partial [bacterium]|nr:MBL fold metallo-hydrolase [bacterium]